MNLKKYRLRNGNIYWHKLYFDIVPTWMTKYGPPLGSYSYAGYLYQPHRYLRDIYDQIKWFIQRGYRGYSDSDLWSLDWYLAGWMPQALMMLKKRKHGHPVGLIEQSWNAKLDRMINAFKIAQKIKNYDYKTIVKTQMAQKQFRKDFNVFKNYYFSLWD